MHPLFFMALCESPTTDSFGVSWFLHAWVGLGNILPNWSCIAWCPSSWCYLQKCRSILKILFFLQGAQVCGNRARNRACKSLKYTFKILNHQGRRAYSWWCLLYAGTVGEEIFIAYSPIEKRWLDISFSWSFLMQNIELASECHLRPSDVGCPVLCSEL